MDSAVLTLAKGMLSYETKDLDTIFTACEQPALILLSKYIPVKSLSNYITSQTITYTSASLGDYDYTTKLKVSDVRCFNIGDMINIPDTPTPSKVYAGNFVVLNIDYDEETIEIYKTFTVTETGSITNTSLSATTYAHAYMILYTLAMNSQSIVKGDVIYSSQQFGQGSLAPSSMSEKKLLADRYFNEAMRFVGNIRTTVV